MKTVKSSRVRKIISNFAKTRVLVIGDLILDQFIWGKVDRISPEAPVPVVWVDSESFMPGGASNVARNIRALEGEAYLAGVIGDDKNGSLLLQELERENINVGGVIIDEVRPTTVKTRIIAHSQQVVRVDREKIDHIEDSIIKEVVSFANKIINSIDAIIIEDYGKGLIVPRLLKKIVPLAKRHNKIITVDPKSDHFSYYKGVTAITPNRAETQNGSGMKIQSDEDINLAGRRMLRRLKLESLLVTLGEEGMRLFEGRKIIRIPTVAQEVFDVSGAGDTVIAAFTLALAAGANFKEAALIANFAAGIVVGKVGTAVATKKELWQNIRRTK